MYRNAKTVVEMGASASPEYAIVRAWHHFSTCARSHRNCAACAMRAQSLGHHTLLADSEPHIARVPLPMSRDRINSAVMPYPLRSVQRVFLNHLVDVRAS